MTFIILFALLVVAFWIDNAVLGMLSIVAIIAYSIYYVIRKVKKKQAKKVPETQTDAGITIKVTAGSDDGTYYTKIAGVQYRCTNDDVGGFLGYVRSDKNNPHDKNSIAVYNNDNKLLGYIPKENQSSFREYSEKDDLPCVGFINIGNDVPLYGKVKIIDSDTEETKLIITKYVHWLISTFGVRFVPSSFSIDVKVMPKTKKEWIETLDYYIDKMENELYEEI